jgi:hypothetical protein
MYILKYKCRYINNSQCCYKFNSIFKFYLCRYNIICITNDIMILLLWLFNVDLPYAWNNKFVLFPRLYYKSVMKKCKFLLYFTTTFLVSIQNTSKIYANKYFWLIFIFVNQKPLKRTLKPGFSTKFVL